MRTGWLLLLWLPACTPSRDSVLKDVERNYTATGFLDTDTFQVKCALGEGAAPLEACDAKLLDDLVSYKERYDREAFARRMHTDFAPFMKPADPAEEIRLKWRAFYKALAENHTRVVHERQAGDGFDATYRLRVKNLIYRAQKAE